MNSRCVNKDDLALLAMEYTHDAEPGGLWFVRDDTDFGPKYLVDES